MVRCWGSLSLSEALSPAPLPFRAASGVDPGPSTVDSEHFLGVRALLARRRVLLSLEGASSGPPFTLSCRCDTVRMRPGALAAGAASVLMHREDEATVLRAKLGTGADTRGALGVGGGGLGSSSGFSGSRESERQILFSSGFWRGRLRRGLALGLRTEPRACSADSLPGRPLMEPLARGSRGSSAVPPVEVLRGDVSEVPFTELRRAQAGSEVPGVSREGRFQPPEPLLEREMGTTLRMFSFSDAVKVRTPALGGRAGLVAAAPAAWPRRALPVFGAPGDASLSEFLLSVAAGMSPFPLAGLSLQRPPLAIGSLFLEPGVEEAPVGMETGDSPAPEDTDASPWPSSPPPPRSASPTGRLSVPSEQSSVREQSVASEM